MVRGRAIAVTAVVPKYQCAEMARIALGRGRWQSKLPLGSFLAAAAMLVVFFGEPMLAWYRGLFGG